MPAVWFTVFDESTGEVALSNGTGLDLDDIPGQYGSTPWLKKLNNQLQALVDVVELRSDMLTEDPDKSMLAGDFQALYGGRRFIDGQYIVDRSTEVFVVVQPDGSLKCFAKSVT